MKQILLMPAALLVFGVSTHTAGAMSAESANPGSGNRTAFIRIADNATEFEATMWNIVKKSGKPKDYEAYLEVFPNGQYADTAREALARLRAAQPKAAPKPSRSIKLLPEEELEEIGRTYVVRTDANLRAAPGTNFRIVGHVAQGQSIFVLARIVGKGWYKVSTEAGLIAYIASFLVGEPDTVAPVPAPKAAAPQPAPPAPAPSHTGPSKEPETPAAPAPVPAATPAPARKSPEEIRAHWTRQIDAVKNAGPHGSCDLVVGSRWEDPPEYDLCEENNAKIKALEQEMKRALGDG